jgi:hypothetical protein
MLQIVPIVLTLTHVVPREKISMICFDNGYWVSAPTQTVLPGLDSSAIDAFNFFLVSSIRPYMLTFSSAVAFSSIEDLTKFFVRWLHFF